MGLPWWKQTSWLERSAGRAATDAAQALAEAENAKRRAEAEAQAEAERLRYEQYMEQQAEKQRQIEIVKKKIETNADRRAIEQLKSFGITPTPDAIKSQVQSKFTWANQQFVALQNEIRQKAVKQLTKTTGDPGEHFGFTMEQLTAAYHDLPLEKVLQSEIARQWAKYYFEGGNPTLAAAYSERAKQIDEKGFPALPLGDEQQTISTLIHSEYPRLNAGEIEELLEKINMQSMTQEDIERFQALEQIPAEKPKTEWAMGIYDPEGKNRENLRKFVSGLFTGLAYIGLGGEQFSASWHYLKLRKKEGTLTKADYAKLAGSTVAGGLVFQPLAIWVMNTPKGELTTEEKLFLDTGDKSGLGDLTMRGAITQAYRQIPSYGHAKGIIEASWPGYWVGVGAIPKKAPFPKPPSTWYEAGAGLYKVTPQGMRAMQLRAYTIAPQEIATQKALGSISVIEASSMTARQMSTEGLLPYTDTATYVVDMLAARPQSFSSTRTIGRRIMLKLKLRSPDTMLEEYDFLDAADLVRRNHREAAENAIRTSPAYTQLSDDLARYGGSEAKLLGLQDGRITVEYIRPRVPGKSMAWGDVFSHPLYYEWIGEHGQAALKYRNDWMNVMNRYIPSLLNYYGVKVTKETLSEGAEHVGRSVIGKAGIEEEVLRSGWGSMGAKMSAEKLKVFATMDEGLKAGFKYADPQDTIKFKTMEAYNKASGQEIIKVLKPLTKTPTQRMEAGIRAIQANLVAQVRNRQYIQQILNRVSRGEKPTTQTIAAVGRRDPVIAELMSGGKIKVNHALKQNKALLEEARANWRDYQPIWKKEIRRVRSPSYTQGRIISQPGFANRVFVDIVDESGRVVLTGRQVATRLNEYFAIQTPGKYIGTAAQVSRILVMAEASLDLSWAAIQGLPVLWVDGLNAMKGRPSHAWATGVKMMFSGFFKPQSLTKFRQAHAATYEWASPLGLVTESAEFTAGATVFERGLARIPKTGNWLATLSRNTFGRANTGFSSAGEAARISLIESLEKSWLAGGGTRAELVDFANKITGVISSRQFAILGKGGVSAQQRAIESALLFAPRYLRANLMLIMDALTGKNMTASMARQTLAAGFGMTVAGYTTISLALGQEPKLNPTPKSVGGDGGDFMTIGVGNIRVGLPGFMYGFIRLLANVSAAAVKDPEALVKWDFGENPTLRFVAGKFSPPVSLARELVKGEYFWGEPFESKKDYLTVIAEKFMTIASQSFMMKGVTTEDKWRAFAAEILGMRTHPNSVWDRRDELREKYAQEDFDCSWESLNGAMTEQGYYLLGGYQTEIIARHPDLKALEIEAQEESTKRFKLKYPELFD